MKNYVEDFNSYINENNIPKENNISKELQKTADYVINQLIDKKNREVQFLERFETMLSKMLPNLYKWRKNVVTHEYEVIFDKYLTVSDILDFKYLLNQYPVIILGFDIYDDKSKKYYNIQKYNLDTKSSPHSKYSKIATGIQYKFK